MVSQFTHNNWNVQDLYKRAKALRAKGRLEEAIEICTKGLVSYPLSIDLRCQLGLALYEKGNYREARKELEEVVRTIERNQIASKVLKMIPHVGKRIEAPSSSGPLEKEKGEDFVSIPPVKRTRTLAELYRKQGYIKEALLIYSELLAYNPDDSNLKEALMELKAQVEGGSSVVATLESWQKTIRKRIEQIKGI